jgi:hypothetical protein
MRGSPRVGTRSLARRSAVATRRATRAIRRTAATRTHGSAAGFAISARRLGPLRAELEALECAQVDLVNFVVGRVFRRLVVHGL